jgi:methionyl aminopeptidase
MATITLKTAEQIELIKIAGQVCASCLDYLFLLCKPGISTLELDRKAEEFIRANGCIPATIGYKGYQHTLCVGINSQGVHCVPSNAIIKEGDLVKFDLVVSYQGWHSDSAITLLVPPIRPDVKKFVEGTQEALWSGIRMAKEGNFVGDISKAIFDMAGKLGYGVVVPFVGHGIGKAIHEAPSIPNIPQQTKGSMLVSGQTICIEPIFLINPAATIYHSKDQWDTWTLDGSLVAHWEHSVLVKTDGFEVLTLRKDEENIGL